MAQISKGDTFADSQQLTATRLNQLVDNAQLLVGAITDQPSITANTLEATDSTIVNDNGVLKEATIGDILNSNLPVSTSSVTGGAGVDIVITPASGQKVDIAGNAEVDDLTVTDDLTVGGDASVTGTLSVTGASTLGSASATSLTIDGKTPMTTQDNLTKSYVKVGVATSATGGGVENLVYQTPVLTVPSDETWTYEVLVQTTSGNVNGQTRPDYASVQLRVYNNATLLATINGSTSPYGGHTATHAFAVAFTSADASPRLILKTFNTWGLNEQPRFMVRLTKVKTSTLSDASSCI
jgi:hypothetical protein